MPLRQARATRQNGAGAGVRARAGAGALARAFRLLFLLLLPAALGAYALAWGLSAALWPDTPPATPRPHLQHAHARAAGAHRYDELPRAHQLQLPPLSVCAPRQARLAEACRQSPGDTYAPNASSAHSWPRARDVERRGRTCAVG